MEITPCSSGPLLESVSTLSREMQPIDKRIVRQDLPVPSEIAKPFDATTSYSPCMLVIPKTRSENGVISSGPSRFCAWLNVNGHIEYAFFEKKEWNRPKSCRFSVNSVVSAPMAALLDGNIFVCWAEKERGLLLAKIGERDVTCVAPYALGMKEGIAIVADEKNARLVLAWSEGGCIQLVTVDTVGNVSTPMPVVEHKGAFSMAIWNDNLYIITGGKNVAIYLFNATTLAEIQTFETEYRSQGAISFQVVGTGRPKLVMAWADAKMQLNMRILHGLTVGDLDPQWATVMPEILVKTAPTLVVRDTETILLSWLDVHNTINMATQTSSLGWCGDLQLNPMIYNATVTGTWYISLYLPPNQPAPVPMFQALIGALPLSSSTTMTAYQFSANVQFSVPSLPNGWFIKVQYSTNGGSTWTTCPYGDYMEQQWWTEYWTTTYNQGYTARIQIVPPGSY